MVAAVAGADCQLPPPDVLGRFRTPADTDGIADWLGTAADGADAAVVCLDTLGYGGLIPSRITAEDTETVLRRWAVLRELRTAVPDRPLYGVSVVMRASNSYHGDEEPPYWPRVGRELHELGAVLHAERTGDPVAPRRRAELESLVPQDIRADFLTRRLRNHVLNLEAIRLAAAGVFDTLLVTSDDTAEYAAGSVEGDWLRYWISALHAGGTVLAHPGADEVGSVLVAKALLRHAGLAPTVRVHCPVPGADARIAPYENVPVAQTAARQVAAAGGRLVTDGPADLHLVLNPPAVDGAGWGVGFAPDPDPAAVAPVAATVRDLLGAGHLVALADVRYVNGADPLLLSHLGAELTGLAGYAGWNTAGNTIGSVLGHGLARFAGLRTGTGDETAHRRLLGHRLLEDAGYQADVRNEVATALGGTGANLRPTDLADAERRVADGLADRLAAAPWRAGLRLVPGSVRLPWGRTFEVDFALESA